MSLRSSLVSRFLNTSIISVMLPGPVLAMQFSSGGSEGLFVQFVVCDLVFPLAVCRCPHHQIPPFLFSQYSTRIFTELVCDVELKSLPAVGMKEVIYRTADIRKSLTWSNVVRVVIQ